MGTITKQERGQVDGQRLTEKIGIDDGEINWRKDFTQFDEADCQNLEQTAPVLDDIAEGLGMHRNEAIKYVEELDAEGLLTKQSSGGKLFYAGKHSISNSKS